MGYQKAKNSLFFATVTLLSCCSPAASSVLPRVTRTDDAIIVDCKLQIISFFFLQIFAKCDELLKFSCRLPNSQQELQGTNNRSAARVQSLGNDATEATEGFLRRMAFFLRISYSYWPVY